MPVEKVMMLLLNQS